MKYVCVEQFVLEKCDEDGFTIENENIIINKYGVWTLESSSNGMHTLTSSCGWINVDTETLEEMFVSMNLST